MQGVLHSVCCTAVRFHGGAAPGQPGVRMRMRDPVPPCARAVGGACVRSGTRQRHPCGSCLWRCVPRRVRRARGRAGGKWARSGEHAATAEERAVLCAVLPCCPDSLARHEQRGCGQALGFRHTARRRLRRAGCEGVGSRGSLEPGAMEQRALRTPSPLLHISVGNVRWWGVVMAVGSAPERGDGGEGRALAAQHTRTVRVTRNGACKVGKTSRNTKFATKPNGTPTSMASFGTRGERGKRCGLVLRTPSAACGGSACSPLVPVDPALLARTPRHPWKVPRAGDYGMVRLVAQPRKKSIRIQRQRRHRRVCDTCLEAMVNSTCIVRASCGASRPTHRRTRLHRSLEPVAPHRADSEMRGRGGRENTRACSWHVRDGLLCTDDGASVVAIGEGWALGLSFHANLAPK